MYLNNHTYYSMRYGTLSEDELLSLAQQYGCKKLPITDINNTSACLNFVRRASEFDVEPIVGVDFRNRADQLFVALAKNNEGFLEINNFLSHHLHHNEDIAPEAPPFKNAIVIYPFEKVLLLEKTEFAEHEYIGIHEKELNKLRFSSLSKYRDRLVALHTVSFRGKRDYNIHRLLRAIDNNTLLSKLSEEEQGDTNDRMIPLHDFEAFFVEYPYIVENTQKVLSECSIEFNFSRDQNHRTFGFHRLYGAGF